MKVPLAAATWFMCNQHGLHSTFHYRPRTLQAIRQLEKFNYYSNVSVTPPDRRIKDDMDSLSFLLCFYIFHFLGSKEDEWESRQTVRNHAVLTGI